MVCSYHVLLRSYSQLRAMPSQITEYYVIRRGRYRVADLYHAEKSGWYYYTYGINCRCAPLP